MPKQVRPLDDDDDDITESTRKKCYGSTVSELHCLCLRTALCESIRYQAKSEQNVRQDLIPRCATGRLLSAPLFADGVCKGDTDICAMMLVVFRLMARVN